MHEHHKECPTHTLYLYSNHCQNTQSGITPYILIIVKTQSGITPYILIIVKTQSRIIPYKEIHLHSITTVKYMSNEYYYYQQWRVK